ncbi:MAG TPA: methyltransferase domain-containing protein [Burkholderiales bacterium]|nr:methyltransferase domain-containing protein [Burkholderiales bacterium]
MTREQPTPILGVQPRGSLNPRILSQLQRGMIVCPETRARLFLSADGRALVSGDGGRAYSVAAGGAPLLLEGAAEGDEFASSSNMESEYSPEVVAGQGGVLARVRNFLFNDRRSENCRRAFREVFPEAGPDEVYLSVGGGPARPSPHFTNLNIGPFPNVDIVADAHRLPYADGAVDAIYCEAVLEHLYAPGRAVEEMHRVLKPGGKVFACTPFLQAYHGYPHHYQNYTVTGHQRLFSDRGFRVLEAGACVGPMYTWISLTQILLAEYAPAGRWLARAWLLVSAPLRALDAPILRRESAHVMASTTYLVAEKAP